jgi:hypothetical protein
MSSWVEHNEQPTRVAVIGLVRPDMVDTSAPRAATKNATIPALSRTAIAPRFRRLDPLPRATSTRSRSVPAV